MTVFDKVLTLFGKQKKTTQKTIAQYKQELLVSAGRAQFESLLQKHIKIPVVLL